jgi:hypothetical protein
LKERRHRNPRSYECWDSISWVKAKQIKLIEDSKLFGQLLLFKTFNDKIPYDKCIFLNIEQQNSSPQINFMINRNNNLVVGLNALSNRLISLNGEIPLVWLNENFVRYKLLGKKDF